MKKRYHSDGLICKEGTKNVPKRYSYCCDEFQIRTTKCELDIRYEWYISQKSWVIAVPETAGGGGIIISYCPHCGSKLNTSKKTLYPSGTRVIDFDRLKREVKKK
jgi:hypothetical protein